MIKRPISVYVHIPFCQKKCLYCDFLSAAANERTKERYVKKLCARIEEAGAQFRADFEVRTIFIGGGTPTCLSAAQLESIGKSLKKFAPFAADIEYTVEANPGTVTENHVRAFQAMGVNRVSLGLQSANENELAALGRIHTCADFLTTYELLRKNGFDNINADIMSALPHQTLNSYQKTLDAVLGLQTEHISAYSLIVEKGTPFDARYQKGVWPLPDEESEIAMDKLTQRILKENGYARYEISNYAREGKKCRHNLTYWEMGEYIGFGLGASSFVNGERFSNCSDLSAYLSAPPGGLIQKRHRLTLKEEREEYVFLGLRKTEGISTADYKKRFGADFYDCYAKVLPPFFAQGLLAADDSRDRIRLTDLGLDVSNQVLAEFLLD